MSASPAPAKNPQDRLNEMGAIRALISAIRSRILGGLIAALPIVLTFWIVYWLYATVSQVVLLPVIELVRYVLGNHGFSERIWYTFISPIIAVCLLLTFLYFLGLFVRTRFHNWLDWLMLRVPVVNTVFNAVNNVFSSVGQQLQGDQGFKRVVLVPFPQPGMRSLAFVTNTLHDASTGRTILCVCVLTGVMPPSGFTLFIPEEDATDVDWSVNQTLQAILSGGITTPATIRYFSEGTRNPD